MHHVYPQCDHFGCYLTRTVIVMAKKVKMQINEVKYKLKQLFQKIKVSRTVKDFEHLRLLKGGFRPKVFGKTILSWGPWSGHVPTT